MASETCPECGKQLPSELGQHSVAPLSGLATCPHCGAEVHVPKPGVPDQEKASSAPAGAPGGAGGGGQEQPEIFSGHETVEGVMEEIEEKPGGTQP
jgi:hypothetical protein